MNRRRMFGFLDPISLGFILAIAGTVSALSFGHPSAKNDGSQASAASQQVLQQQLANKD